MTAADVDLDALLALYAKATPGDWKLWGMTVMADQDGTSNYDTAVEVAHTFYRDENGKPRTFDASLICEMQRALPALVQCVKDAEESRDALAALVDEWKDVARQGEIFIEEFNRGGDIRSVDRHYVENLVRLHHQIRQLAGGRP